jgi:hypothetical protein
MLETCYAAALIAALTGINFTALPNTTVNLKLRTEI